MDLFDGEDDDDDDARPANCGVLVFHDGTEEALLATIESTVGSVAKDPELVLRAVDDFCERRHWMMNVGPEKGKILLSAVAGVKSRGRPICVCELGVYVGYSAVLVGKALGPDDRFLGVEIDPRACEWARRVVRLAGLEHRIEICCADASTLAAQIERRAWPAIDVLFIDHDKAAYLRDLRAVEAKLASPGGVVVADNVLSFDGGASMRDYLAYVRGGDATTSPFVESVFYPASVEYSGGGPDMEDGVEVSVHR
ncbi:hypothetical protein CTAYLR_001195 [Chrysophaeum taylorii]|uniref:catechol O-methyltransferase n=1 Tax=Chrysophaeum taylorii TaxID=2483200 RepID=A0AAD7UEP6_9STRA|nr:hypothetical protein CTAYLR_001195 [Chrysophaeum taylorii]